MNFFPHLSHRGRTTTWALMLVTFAVGLTGLLNLQAAPVAIAKAEEPGRYLVIVETSEAMRRRTDGTQKLLGDLVRSGFNGQLRAGDTIGVWTFNDKLSTGVFPLQIWTPQTRERIAGGLVGFLQAQRHEKTGKLAPVVADMASLIKESEMITVLLVTSGTDKINGTTYDEEINATYTMNQPVQEKARLPYVTILRAVKGEFSGYTVSTPPWPVEFPKFAPAPATPKPVAVIPRTPTEAEREQQRLAALRQTLEGGKVISITSTSSATPLSLGTVVTNPPTAPPAAPEPTTPKVAPATLAESTTPEPQSQPATVTVTPTPPIPAPSEPPQAVFKVVPETNATPPPSTRPAESVRAVPPPPKPVEPAVMPPPVQAAPAITPPSPAVADAPAERALPRSVILIAGGTLVLVAVVLLIVLLRRPTRRPPERISLITRSLDKEKK